MKASEWLKEYQLTGKVPSGDGGETTLAFWCGWLLGPSHSTLAISPEERLSMAIKAAEFIEGQE